MFNNNNKVPYIAIIALLIFVIIFMGAYLIYRYNNEEDCLCEEGDNLVMNSDISEVDTTDTFDVEVKGAVTNPGVYEMTSANIIADLIATAGGFNTDAYTDNINLSKKLSAELVVYVYTKKEYNGSSSSSKKPSNAISAGATYDISNAIEAKESMISSDTITAPSANNEASSSESATSSKPSIININTASQKELTTLPGIGESKASKIISYREENGKFKSIEDIMNVSGIGEATFEKLKSYITV